MNEQPTGARVVGAAVVHVAGLPAGCAVPKGALHQDSQGRFTMEIDPAWQQVEPDGSTVRFSSTDLALQVFMFALDTGTDGEAYTQAFEVSGVDPGLLRRGGLTTFGDWEAFARTDAAELTSTLSAQILRNRACVLVVAADEPGVSPDSAAVTRALTSFEPAGNGAGQATVERLADPDQDLMVMSSLNGYGAGQIADAVVSAWMRAT